MISYFRLLGFFLTRSILTNFKATLKSTFPGETLLSTMIRANLLSM
ncbi:MAG: hypothetical protein NDF56_06485 [archaeon GB-1845-036]|nr:hypothetical protein [Candidatus Culexmicrobium thermophilum]